MKADKTFYDTLRDEVNNNTFQSTFNDSIRNIVSRAILFQDFLNSEGIIDKNIEALKRENAGLRSKLTQLEMTNNGLTEKNNDLEAKIHKMNAAVSEDYPDDNSKKLTIRQLVILFESLMDITLSSSESNISAFSRLIGCATGKSDNSIRQIAMRHSYENKQTKQDAKEVAELLRPVKPDLAEKILNNIEE